MVGGVFQLKNSTGNLAIDSYVAAEVIPEGLRVLAVEDDGEVVLADYQDVDHADRIVGIGLSAAGIGGDILVQKMGLITNSAWSWTVGKGIFFDEDGILTQDVPLFGFLLHVAKPVSVTSIDILVRLPIVRA